MQVWVLLLHQNRLPVWEYTALVHFWYQTNYFLSLCKVFALLEYMQIVQVCVHWISNSLIFLLRYMQGFDRCWCQNRVISWVHSLKLTVSHLKIDGWKMYFLLKQSFFRCYVSFREGISQVNGESQIKTTQSFNLGESNWEPRVTYTKPDQTHGHGIFTNMNNWFLWYM